MNFLGGFLADLSTSRIAWDIRPALSVHDRTRSIVADDRRKDRRRRWTLICPVAFLAGLLMFVNTGEVGATPQVLLTQAEATPVDMSTGAVSAGIGAHPSVSGDGRYVAFQGAPPSPDDDRTSTIFFTDRETGETTYGRVPAGSVVVSGSLPSKCGTHSLYAAIIVKKVDAKTRAKVGINEILRGAE